MNLSLLNSRLGCHQPDCNDEEPSEQDDSDRREELRILHRVTLIYTPILHCSLISSVGPLGLEPRTNRL